MCILTHDSYLKENFHKIIIFVWNNRPIDTTGQLVEAEDLEFDHVTFQKYNIY
jgi:hypothetical protein